MQRRLGHISRNRRSSQFVAPCRPLTECITSIEAFICDYLISSTLLYCKYCKSVLLSQASQLHLDTRNVEDWTFTCLPFENNFFIIVYIWENVIVSSLLIYFAEIKTSIINCNSVLCGQMHAGCVIWCSAWYLNVPICRLVKEAEKQWLEQPLANAVSVNNVRLHLVLALVGLVSRLGTASWLFALAGLAGVANISVRWRHYH